MANSQQDLALGRNLDRESTRKFRQQLLEAYPNDPALGSPFDGRDTNYGLGPKSQYKRAAAIATDGNWVSTSLDWTDNPQKHAEMSLKG
jgi:hypothetical protein